MTVTSVKSEKLQFKLKVIESPNMPPSKIKDVPYTWEEVCSIVDSNHLEAFARSSDQTRRYVTFKQHLSQQKTTVFKHLLVNQLHWYNPKDNGGVPVDRINEIDDKNLVIKPTGEKLFEEPSDLCILYNHFPYYFEDDVVHLCIWSKIPIPADPESWCGDILSATRSQVEGLIRDIFVDALGMDRSNIRWFKNWEALQSVKAISHVHVLLKGISEAQLQKLHVQ